MNADINAGPVILVVEDEALLRWHATDMLAEAGFVVIEADDAATALRILDERSDVRLLFTDIRMPGELDGIALAQKVHEHWPKILLLVTSSGPRIADRDIPDHGRFVAKPYLDHEVLGKVQGLLEDQKLGRLGSTHQL